MELWLRCVRVVCALSEAAFLTMPQIQRAYESLMTTDEDARIEALGHK